MIAQISETVTEHTLSQFRNFLAEQIGLYFPAGRTRDLLRGISSAAQEFGFSHSIVHQEFLDKEMPFLQKPFGTDGLGRKVRELLGMSC